MKTFDEWILKADIPPMRKFTCEKAMELAYMAGMSADDEILQKVESLSDRLENGIRYDDKLNCYILVWTKKELDEARKEADRLFEFFHPLPSIDEQDE